MEQSMLNFCTVEKDCVISVRPDGSLFNFGNHFNQHLQKVDNKSTFLKIKVKKTQEEVVLQKKRDAVIEYHQSGGRITKIEVDLNCNDVCEIFECGKLMYVLSSGLVLAAAENIFLTRGEKDKGPTTIHLNPSKSKWVTCYK